MEVHKNGTVNSKDLNLVIEVLKNYLLSEEFKLKSFDIQPASEEHIGFLGEHWRITVNYIYKDTIHNESFFYKTLPKSNPLQASHNKKYRFFEREIFFHANIFNQYKKIEGPKQCIPSCYYAENEDLVFEDLNQKGFIMRDLRNTMDKAHAEIVIKAIAEFHAASLILEENKTKELKRKFRVDELKTDIVGGCLVKGHWYYKCMEEALKIAASSPKYGKYTKHFNKVRTNWMILADKSIDLVMEPPENNRNVVLHLDLWNNNIMFKYDQSSNPIQCMFVDYQCCQISNPAVDVVSFIYLCLSKEVKDEVFEEMVELYYSELKDILKESDINVDDILTKDTWKKNTEDYKIWGVIHGQVLFQFLFLEEIDKQKTANDSDTFEKLINEGRSEELLRSLSKNEDYRIRFMDLIDEFVERYII